MVSSMFSCSRCSFILLVPAAFPFYNLAGVFGALLGEDGVKNIIEYLISPYPWQPGLLLLAGEGPDRKSVV